MKISEIPATDRTKWAERFQRFKEKQLEGKSRVTVAELEAIRAKFMAAHQLEDK